jgi:hypothetical protein
MALSWILDKNMAHICAAFRTLWTGAGTRSIQFTFSPRIDENANRIHYKSKQFDFSPCPGIQVCPRTKASVSTPMRSRLGSTWSPSWVLTWSSGQDEVECHSTSHSGCRRAAGCFQVRWTLTLHQIIYKYKIFRCAANGCRCRFVESQCSFFPARMAPHPVGWFLFNFYRCSIFLVKLG